MKIAEVRTTLLVIPMDRPIGDATATWGAGGGLFVHLKTDDGQEGLGCVYPSSAARDVIERTLKPLITGRDPFEIEGLWRDMFWAVRSEGRKGIAFCALSAVDTALWDLKAKALGLPLYRLLGPCSESVPVYGSGGWTSLSQDELLAEMTGYVDRGMKAVKMKIGRNFGRDEREDLRRVAAVRKTIGDKVTLYVDANNGYYAKQAIAVAERLKDYDVEWFEEPVLADDYEGLAAVARATSIPIATGEHEYTKYGFKELMARGAVDIVQPDAARVGGVTEWIKVAHMAEAFNLPVAPHGIPLVHLQLTCATPNLKIVEYLKIEEDFAALMFKDPPMPKGDQWSPDPARLGLGLELRPDAIAKYAR